MRHLRIYRAIRLIQRQGSIRKAAELLSVSPSALNRAIQGFEDEMKLALFDRVPGGVRLTAAGELLLDLVDRHIVEFEELQQALGALRDGQSGVLRISMASDIAAGMIPEAAAHFAADHPGVSIDICIDDTADALRRRIVDLALVTSPVTDDTLEVLHAQQVPLEAWRTPDGTSPMACSGLWDVVEARLILPPEMTGTRVAFSHLLRRHRLEEGVTTVAPAAQMRAHMGHTDLERRICIYPATVFTRTEVPQGLERLPLDLGSVPLTVLRMARMPLGRSAQNFLRILQRSLDDAVPDSGL